MGSVDYEKNTIFPEHPVYAENNCPFKSVICAFWSFKVIRYTGWNGKQNSSLDKQASLKPCLDRCVKQTMSKTTERRHGIFADFMQKIHK